MQDLKLNIAVAKAWLREVYPNEIDEITLADDADIEAAIDHCYEGGIAQFIEDGKL